MVVAPTPDVNIGPCTGDARIGLWRHIYGAVSGDLALLSGRRAQPTDTDLVTVQTAYFAWPEAAASAALEVARQAENGREVYHCAHLLRQRRRIKQNAADVAALWSDDDGAQIPENLRPTAQVASSAGHCQSYWRLTSAIPAARAEALNRRLAQAIGADPSGYDRTQLLRPPGGRNFKRTPPASVTLLYIDDGRAYDPDELDQVLPAYLGRQRRASSPEAAAIPLPENVGEGDNPPVALGKPAYVRWIGERPTHKPDGTLDRSNSLWWIGVALAEARATREQIVYAVANRDVRLGWRKYTDRPDRDQRYADIADGALDYANAPQLEWPDGGDAATATTEAPRAAAAGPDRANGHSPGAVPLSNGPVRPALDHCPPLPAEAAIDEALAATASPWLDAYIHLSRTWSPRAAEPYHEACGVWVLGTVAARRVYVNLGERRWPSLYILLAGRSSLYAKTTTAKIALHTLRAARLDWLLAADDATPQKFIHDLTGRLPASYTDLTGELQARVRNRLARPAQRGWFYEEFGQHLAAMTREGGYMADFRGILRRFDDHVERHEYGTISRGDDVVLQPYLTLLGNVTPADLRPLAKRSAAMWNDGFWARFAFAVPTSDARKRDRFPEGEREIPSRITEPLRAWHGRLGLPAVSLVQEEQRDGSVKLRVELGPWEPQPCRLGAEVYEAFYTYHDALLDIVAGMDQEDLDGNYCRFAEKALRIAIQLGSLENANQIELRHWARGQAIAERWRAGLHRLFAILNEPEPSATEAMEERCLRAVEALGKATAREVSQRIRGLSSAEALGYLEGLARAGDLDTDRTARTTRYSLPQRHTNEV
jgi:hypothetical protein